MTSVNKSSPSKHKKRGPAIQEVPEAHIEIEKKDFSDIDLNMDYSDNEDKVYFTKNSFWDYLDEIEADNLFKINLCQDEENAFEALKKGKEKKIAEKMAQLKEMQNNIDILEKGKIHLLQKQQFFA